MSNVMAIYSPSSPVSRKTVLNQAGTGNRKSWSGTVMAVSLAAKKTRKTTMTCILYRQLT
jgi:hypothetical protein